MNSITQPHFNGCDLKLAQFINSELYRRAAPDNHTFCNDAASGGADFKGQGDNYPSLS